MFRRPNKPLPVLWAVPICVGIVELFPAASPVTIAVDGLHIWDKLPHFCVYLALSCLSAIGFRDWRRGTIQVGQNLANSSGIADEMAGKAWRILQQQIQTLVLSPVRQ